MGGPVVEAEKYDKNSPISPFEIQAVSGGIEYIIVPGTGNSLPSSDMGPGQAFYTFKATAAQVDIFATVNLATDVTDSFYYQVTGLTPWLTQNMKTTIGFQEIMLSTVAGATVGQTYVFKIQRREAGARFDKFRIVGGVFAEGVALVDTIANPIPNSMPSPFDLVNGKSQYDSQCTSCHGNRGQGGARGRILNARTQEALTNFISETMPPINPRLCEGKCAADVAAYVINGFTTVPK